MEGRETGRAASASVPREPVMPGTLRLGEVSGIEVGIHSSWIIAFALITFSLAAGFLPFVVPGLTAAAYWAMGAIGALLLFVSVLIHEFSHSLVAQARGLPVSSITLFIFGGISSIREEARTPKDEFLVAVVGPLASLVLAALFWGLFLTLGPAVGPFSVLLFYLALVNLTLAVFNLLPGFPLDGGRVLRAIIWAATGSMQKATNWAAGVGQVFAFLLILLGVFQIFAGDLLGGLWIAFIGWFLNGAAESSRRQSAMRETYQGLRVRDLMTPEPTVVEPTLPVRSLIDEYALRRGIRALMVSVGDRVVGIATLADVRKLPPEVWGSAVVEQIMTPAPLLTTEPEARVTDALLVMSERDLNQLPVIDHGRLVGLLTRSNLLRYLRFRDELGALPPFIAEKGEEDQRRAA